MDASENDQFRLKKTADHLNMESDPSIAGSPVIPFNSSPCSSVSMADYFVPMASNENSIPRATNSVNCTHIEKPIAMSSRGLFLPTVPTIPPSLPHFPADSAFVERAAIFSSTCGNFSGMIKSFGPSESVAPCTNVSKDVIGTQLQKITLNMSEAKDGSLPLDHESRSGSPVKDQINKESSHFGVTNNDPYETNSTEGSQETNINSADASGESLPGDLGAKKRKRIDQDKEMGDKVQRVPQSSLKNTKENTKAQQKLELNNLKPCCKHVKDSSEALEYNVHTRARHGRATNSHSIAERLRRERISERMKYLQDLVPGCSRVTGKAVMLDEIINYVQSLQQQVEFLSMKLAAVTPQHNYTIEGPFPNDLHPYDGTLSAAGLPQEIFHPQLYPSQWDPIPIVISSIVNPSNAYRRVMNSHSTTISGYEESELQMHNSWTENLNNVKDDKWY